MRFSLTTKKEQRVHVIERFKSLNLSLPKDIIFVIFREELRRKNFNCSAQSSKNLFLVHTGSGELPLVPLLGWPASKFMNIYFL